MEISPAYNTPPENYEGLSSISPSARTPVVEVIMPIPRNTPTAKRTRVSETGSTRIDRTKRARCAVGSPTIRIINQIQVSTPTTSGAPGSTATQDPRGSRTKDTTSTLRKLFSEYSQTNHADAAPSETNCVQVNTQKDDSFDDWDQYQQTQLRTQSSSELNGYLAENTIPRTEELDILGWWKSNSTIYPVLARMAFDVLSTPASTVPLESAFSTGERVVSDFRSRLSTDTVETLICLQDWMRAVAPSPEKLVFDVMAQQVYKISISILPGSDESVDYAVDHVEDHLDTD